METPEGFALGGNPEVMDFRKATVGKWIWIDSTRELQGGGGSDEIVRKGGLALIECPKGEKNLMRE